MNMKERIQKIAISILPCKFLDQAKTDWQEVVKNSSASPVYSLSLNNFQESYMVGVAEEFHNLSLVLFHDSRAVGVWPLAIKKIGGCFSFCSNASNVIAPLFITDLSPKVQKDLAKSCLHFITVVCQELHIKEWWSEHIVYEKGVDAWYSAVIPGGTTNHITTELYVDLRLPFDAIWSNIRKSYRPLITKCKKIWQIGILQTFDEAIFSEFRQLHFLAAGRATRSDASWQANCQSIRNGEAFLVFLRDTSNIMVGGGLFEITSYAGMYSVAAYNRDLFDLPLGHVVQVAAIEYMQQLGLKLYHIGRRYYPGDVPSPTPKEISISAFKEGFATHVFPKVHVCTLT